MYCTFKTFRLDLTFQLPWPIFFVQWHDVSGGQWLAEGGRALRQSALSLADHGGGGIQTYAGGEWIQVLQHHHHHFCDVSSPESLGNCPEKNITWNNCLQWQKRTRNYTGIFEITHFNSHAVQKVQKLRKNSSLPRHKGQKRCLLIWPIIPPCCINPLRRRQG